MDRVKLFEENMNLAYNEAHKAIRRIGIYEIQDDLIQAALMGLWVACKRYDKSRGLEFSTYATATIRGYIMSCNTHWDTRSERKIIKYNNLKIAKVSTEAQVPGTDETMTIGDTLSEQESLEKSEEDICFEIDFEKFASRLKDREREIIRLRKLELSQSEVGKMMGISQAQVSRHILNIEKKYKIWVNRGKNGENKKK